ncbi:MAG TPA: hypothetical protein VGQ69_15830 [Gemmatimonadales bacterium]|jgi:uncharacterized membrane protein YkoI|nr:hypothetical protein [Gemmatimonadales bacterium]
MRAIVLAAALSLGLAAAGSGQDTIKVVNDKKVQDTTKVQATITIKENKPGLLALAKIQPLDAQHIALTQYPDGTVLKGEITRKRGGKLLYVFMIQPAGEHRKRQVLVDAIDGAIVNTIPLAKPDTAKKVP